jgi:arylsulfatase A-like enzyme
MNQSINRRIFVKSSLLSGTAAMLALKNTFSLTAAGCVSAVAADQKLPNFVFILADDQGWNALSIPVDPDNLSSGSTYFLTPHLARLAKEGMRFSQAYSPAPTCSPTRYAIQFGRSPSSLNIWGADNIGTRNVDARVEDSLANRLKIAHPEYVCAHLGKWHIAFKPDVLGYDVDTGSGDNLQTKDPQDPKFIFSLTEKANVFMAEQVKNKRPFFLQLSHYADHLRYDALPETVERYKIQHADKATTYQNDPVWAAMNENLDTGIGMVLDKIDELGIRDKTYVIYTADNGFEDKKDFGKPVHERGYYKAYPQRSHKYHVSEGGIRVPFIVRGPGIPLNTHSPTPVVGTDVFPTVMDILSNLDHVPKEVEGASLLAHLKSGGKVPVRRKDPFLVFKYSKPVVPHDIAIVQGDYKLIKDVDTGRVFLFNLKEDIGESNNLSDEKPAMAKRMYDDMTAYFKRFGWDESRIFGEEELQEKKH